MSIKFDDDKQPYIDLGQNYFFNFNFRKVDDEKKLAKAREELRETAEIREQSLAELRELIKGEKNLVFPTDDYFLETYLRACKFYAKSAFEKIQTDSKFKLKYKKFYENIDVEATRKVFEDNIFEYGPLNDKDGRRILVINCAEKFKLTQSNHKEVFNAMQLFFHLPTGEPLTQINGCCIILDIKRLDLSIVTALTPSFIAMMLKWCQECIPVRFKKIFIVNNSRIFNMFWALLSPFIATKFKERVHFVNKKYEILAEHLGKECLRKEYDGTFPVDYANGNNLTDLMKFYKKQIELMIICGYVDEEEIIEEQRKKVDACAKEILNNIKV